MVEKCCYFMRLNTGSLLVGVLTLVTSMTVGIYSAVQLGLEHTAPGLGAEHIKLVMHLEFDSKTVTTVLAINVVVQTLWMIFSIILIMGLKWNRPSFLLAYFSFGIVMVILMQLSGLLVLLQKHWILTAIYFIAAVVYIHGLVVVHHVYELMLQGKLLNQPLRDDEDQLWRPELDEVDPDL